jgi:hypothetical protein
MVICVNDPKDSGNHSVDGKGYRPLRTMTGTKKERKNQPRQHPISLEYAPHRTYDSYLYRYLDSLSQRGPQWHMGRRAESSRFPNHFQGSLRPADNPPSAVLERELSSDRGSQGEPKKRGELVERSGCPRKGKLEKRDMRRWTEGIVQEGWVRMRLQARCPLHEREMGNNERRGWDRGFRNMCLHFVSYRRHQEPATSRKLQRLHIFATLFCVQGVFFMSRSCHQLQWPSNCWVAL